MRQQVGVARWGLLGLALSIAGCGGGTVTSESSGHGRIEITVEGLPAGAEARLVVVGPGNAVHNVGAVTDITNLAPGDYTISALHVPYGGQDYTATVAPPSVSVSNDTPANATVTYTGHALPAIDFHIGAIRLFQSVAIPDTSVKVVANRILNVQVAAISNQANGDQASARLYIFQSGTLVDSLTVTGPSTVPTSADLSSLASTWLFSVPANRVLPGMSLAVTIDPDDQWSEADESNNRFPAGSARIAPAVVAVPALKLVLVPVHQAGGNGTVTSATLANFTGLTKGLYPIGTLNASIRAAFTTQAAALVSNDSNGAWGQVLSEINALRVSDNSTGTYYGVVHPNYNSGVAGLGYIGLPAAIGWDKGSGVGEVMAHELGHTFGRQHAPCGNPSGPDPSYPYGGAIIGVWGFDQGTNQLINPNSTYDLMSYCDPVWVSDYTYKAVFSHLTGAATFGAPPAQSGLLVWGRIIGDSLVLEPAFQVTAPPRLPGTGGAYRVTGTASDGSVAFDLSFAGDLVPDLPGRAERHFAFVIPLSEAGAAGLASIRLAGPGRSAIQSTALATGAVADVKQLAGGMSEVTWDARYPMAIVRDARSGQILAFGRNGRTVVESSNGVRVDLSRGPRSEPARIRERK